MKLFNQIHRINLMHKLIKQRRTGTPAELARRLNVSTARIYQIIEELKLMEVPIAYCRQRQTYYYTTAYEIHIDINMRPLNDRELSSANGGSAWACDSGLWQKFFKEFYSTIIKL